MGRVPIRARCAKVPCERVPGRQPIAVQPGALCRGEKLHRVALASQDIKRIWVINIVGYLKYMVVLLFVCELFMNMSRMQLFYHPIPSRGLLKLILCRQAGPADTFL